MWILYVNVITGRAQCGTSNCSGSGEIYIWTFLMHLILLCEYFTLQLAFLI